MRASSQFATALWLGAALLVAACGPDTNATESQAPPVSAEDLIADGPHAVATLTVKGMGAIRVELLPELAPKTVENFIALAGEHFYDGTTFHRVIPGFMIQGGDPNSRSPDPRGHGMGGPGYKLEHEHSALPMDRGVVAMASTGRRNSGSQFFIVHQDRPDLNGRFTAFGRVVGGLAVVDAITQAPIDTYGRYGPPARPYPEHVVIESIRMEPAAGS